MPLPHPPPVPLDPLVCVLLERHPDLPERLEAVAPFRLLVQPAELPVALLFTVTDARRIRAELLAAGGRVEADARIRAPLAVLVDLVEGRVDGDAAFFGRMLEVDGRSDVVVAVRNALEDAEIVLARDLLAPLGPLAAPARLVLGTGARLLDVLAERVERDVATPLRALLRVTVRTLAAAEHPEETS